MFHCIDKNNKITINGDTFLLDYIRVKMIRFPGWRYMIQVQPFDGLNIPDFSFFTGTSIKAGTDHPTGGAGN